MADGQRFAIPVVVKGGESISIVVAAAQLSGDARVTCIITDEGNAQLVTSSAVVSVNPSVTCSWTNSGK